MDDDLLERLGCFRGSGGTLTKKDSNERVFVKWGTGGNSDAPLHLLEYEAKGLEALGAASRGSELKVPKVFMTGIHKGQAFLAMEHIDRGRNSGSCMRLLGEGLRHIHSSSVDGVRQFGFPMDGCLGDAPQPNEWRNNWVDFWRDQRLGFQIESIKKHYGDMAFVEEATLILKEFPQLFSDLIVEDIQPSTLHGDLWGGNWCVDSESNPVIFDPAVYYGHWEADLGIANMFGGFSKSFFDSFPSVPPGRAALYELHHHMNHYVIFGSSYRGGCMALIKKIRQVLKS